MFKWIKSQIVDTIKLLQAIPSLTLMFFILSVVITNLMAVKFIVNTNLMQVTGGLLLSWLPFLCMDITAKHFGAVASVKLNLFGLLIYLGCVLLFELVTHIQICTVTTNIDYTAFNLIYSAQWKILVSSSVAYVASGIVNAFVHHLVGAFFKKNPNGKGAYYTQSYLSTFFGQFSDNFIFVGLLNCFLLGLSWPIMPVLGAALLGGTLELLTQMLFSVFGYKMLQRWQRCGVGKEYIESHKAASQN